MTPSPVPQPRPGADHGTAPGWDATLDDLEASLEAWETWLADTTAPTPEQWQPPTGLPPLGHEHAARARTLHDRYQELTAHAAGRLDDVRRERGQVSAPRSAPGYAATPQATYLDLQA